MSEGAARKEDVSQSKHRFSSDGGENALVAKTFILFPCTTFYGRDLKLVDLGIEY